MTISMSTDHRRGTPIVIGLGGTGVLAARALALQNSASEMEANGASRVLGRLGLFLNSEVIERAIRLKLKDLGRKVDCGHLAKGRRVVVCSSIAGGTGAGMLINMAVRVLVFAVTVAGPATSAWAVGSGGGSPSANPSQTEREENACGSLSLGVHQVVLRAGPRAYVLDHSGDSVPMRMPGELYFTGVGLERGDLERPELTIGRSVPDPFTGGGRFFRTEDLAFWLAGPLKHLGKPAGDAESRMPVNDPLVAIWVGVPSIEQIGVHYGFFEFGDHSLLASQEEPAVLAARAEVLLAGPRAPGSTWAIIEHGPVRPVPRKGSLPLFFSQERLWFLDQFELGTPLRVRARACLDPSGLAASVPLSKADLTGDLSFAGLVEPARGGALGAYAHQALSFEPEGEGFRALLTAAAGLEVATVARVLVPLQELLGTAVTNSPDEVVAIHKAYAAYLPLDPAYPRARPAFTLADAREPLAVVAPAQSGPLPAAGSPRACLEGDLGEIMLPAVRGATGVDVEQWQKRIHGLERFDESCKNYLHDPTESTVGMLARHIDAEGPGVALSLGRPLAVSRPELTAERFRPGGEREARLYNLGDFATVRVEFLCRIAPLLEDFHA